MSRDLKCLMAAMLLWGIGEGLFIYLYPLYLAQLGADSVAIGAIMSASALGVGLAHTPAGWLADRLGRKPVMFSGWLVGCLAATTMFLAPGLAWFVLGLVLYMLTAYVVSPMSAYITEACGSTFSVQRAFMLNSACFAAGTLFSPALGGQIARVLGLRSVFGLSLIVFVVSTLLVSFIRPQPITAPAEGVNRYGSLLANRRFVGFMALVFAVAIAFQLGFPLASNFLADVRRLDVGTVGLLGSCNALGMMVLNVALGHRRPRGILMLAQALMMLSLGLLLGTGSLGWLALAFFCRGSWSVMRNMANAQVGLVVEKLELGLAYGVTETVMALAMIVGPLAAGFLYARTPGLPFQVGLALLAVTVPLVWRFAPKPARL